MLLMIPVILSGCAGIGVGGGKSSKDEFIKGSVVKGFPNLPLYPKAQVIESYGFEGKYGANFVVNKPLKEVIKFYQEALPKLGWESTPSQVSESNYIFEVKNSDFEGEVIVNTAADSKKTAITFTASAKSK